MTCPTQYTTRRGQPLSPVQQVCVALNSYAGGHFQRITGLSCGISQSTAWRAIHIVMEALCRRKGQFIRMPSVEEMEENAQRIEEKYNLPRHRLTV